MGENRRKFLLLFMVLLLSLGLFILLKQPQIGLGSAKKLKEEDLFRRIKWGDGGHEILWLEDDRIYYFLGNKNQPRALGRLDAQDSLEIEFNQPIEIQDKLTSSKGLYYLADGGRRLYGLNYKDLGQELILETDRSFDRIISMEPLIVESQGQLYKNGGKKLELGQPATSYQSLNMDGPHILSLAKDGGLSIYDKDSLEELGQLKTQGGRVLAEHDGKIYIYDGKKLRSYSLDQGLEASLDLKGKLDSDLVFWGQEPCLIMDGVLMLMDGQLKNLGNFQLDSLEGLQAPYRLYPDGEKLYIDSDRDTIIIKKEILNEDK